ncbi:hypothetical protein C1H46_015709 [Malus baccata]|uniref:USP domain-containing protein n=1 Tax=Malus baccata TaxID=106549 RepID=A0A540MKD7_MALBA|nr:hypothetical protein C1H46_015709 [Malus baccata]
MVVHHHRNGVVLRWSSSSLMGLQFQLQMSWQPSLLSQKHKNGLPPLRLRNLGNFCYLNNILRASPSSSSSVSCLAAANDFNDRRQTTSRSRSSKHHLLRSAACKIPYPSPKFIKKKI